MNGTPSTVTMGLTPVELWSNRRADTELFKVFGCEAWVHIQDTDKLEPRAVRCMYIGRAAHKKGFKLLNLHENTIVYSRNVVFREHVFPKLEFLKSKLHQIP
jgi:hypothetical protein